jgi:excisionase family DNA binding protein
MLFVASTSWRRRAVIFKDGGARGVLSQCLDWTEGFILKTREPKSTTMADKDDVLLNSREVAFLLDLSPDTVNEFARRNVLPAFKKGRQWRFRKRDIASFKRQMRGINAAA